MKVLVVLVFTIVLSVANSEENGEDEQVRDRRSSTLDRMPLHYGKRIPPRSLRSILDRMSAGYGKRDSQGQRIVWSTNELAALIATEPSLARALVNNYIDTDGDGLVSSNELYGSGQ